MIFHWIPTFHYRNTVFSASFFTRQTYSGRNLDLVFWKGWGATTQNEAFGALVKLQMQNYNDT